MIPANQTVMFLMTFNDIDVDDISDGHAEWGGRAKDLFTTSFK